MTDEFYACGNCGAREEGTFNKYLILGIDKYLTTDELEQVEEICGRKNIEYDEIPFCSRCEEEYDGF